MRRGRSATDDVARVLFVIGSLRLGGMEGQACALARELHRRGIRCRVVCLTERGVLADGLERDGIPVQLVSTRALLAALRFRPNVAYAFGLIAYVVALPIAAVLLPRALRVSGRRAQADIDLYARFPRLSVLARRATNRVTHLAIANDASVAATHVAEDPSLAPRMHVIRNGVALPAVIAPAPGPGALRIVCIANLRPEKEHGVLLQAVAALPLELPWTLDIVGDGPMMSEVLAAAAALPQPERVTLHGARTDAVTFLPGASVFVLTSRSEGMPNVVLEAFAAGVPVVATAVGAVPELLAAGGGTVVPVNDVAAIALALERYLRDPALRRRTGDAGRSSVRRFGIDVAVDRHLALFRGAST